MSMGTVHGSSVSVAATASNVQESIVMPSVFDALHIANTSATLYVSVRWGASAQTATLGSSLTIPPMSHVTIEANNKVTDVAAIGSGAGPTAVVFTPVKLSAGS